MKEAVRTAAEGNMRATLLIAALLALAAPAVAQQVWCTTVFQNGSPRNVCGTVADFVAEANTVCARREVAWSDCAAARAAADKISALRKPTAEPKTAGPMSE